MAGRQVDEDDFARMDVVVHRIVDLGEKGLVPYRILCAPWGRYVQIEKAFGDWASELRNLDLEDIPALIAYLTTLLPNESVK